MQHLPATTLFLLLLSLSTTNAYNITTILAKHPEFSTFNHYLTLTHLAGDINRRMTITVCAVDNAAMDDLLSKHLSLPTIKNVLSLHVFADYFGSKKLHQLTGGSTLTATIYQATGDAPGTAGYVNITNLKGGKVGFAPQDNSATLDSLYVKSVQELPYKISVIEISKVLTSPEAEAPAAGPSNISLTGLMSRQGCKAFSDLLMASDAEKTFSENMEGGLTVFCPSDGAINAFMPRYKNLTVAGKVSVLQYHGVPVYQSMGMLKSSNGLMNTLATDGSNKFDFTIQNSGEDVTLKTKVVTATIMGTLIDEEPVAVYKINKVLLPRELFKAAPAAPAPKGAKVTETDAAAPEPDTADEDPADATATENGAVGIGGGGRFGAVVLGLGLGVLAML